MKHVSIVVLGLFAAVAVCRIAGAQTPPPSLVTCTRLTDPRERLGCYDTQMTALGASIASPPSAPPAALGAAPKSEVANTTVTPAPTAVAPAPAAVAPAPVPAPSAAQRFGADNLAPAARAKVEKPDKVLLSTIASIREARPKLWVIVLTNGQIWLQDGTQITSFFRAGYDARIERGLLGDYRMSTTQTGEKNVVRVTRIQ